jgi:hypothetical protein
MYVPFRIIITFVTTSYSYGAFVISRIEIKSDALLGAAGVGSFCCGAPAHGVSVF